MSTLQICKAIPENLLGDNLHHEQGNGIPKDLDKQTLAKRKENKDACEPSRSKRQKSCNESGLFGDNCMICKKHQIKVGHKFQLQKKSLTLDAANNIKKAAEMTEDEEFKRHDKCYRDYTRALYATKTKTPVNEKGNFEDVCRFKKMMLLHRKSMFR